MGRRINIEEIIGKRFGKLIVKEFSHRDKNSNPHFLCECDCGNKKIINYSSLRSGLTKSCGRCLERTEIGKRFGKLTIKEFSHRDKYGISYFLCKCDCGNERIVSNSNLKFGSTISCGHCLERTEIGKRFGKLTIKEFSYRDKDGRLYFLCQCDCGKDKVISYDHLKSKHATSCNHCLERTEIGKRFGHYTIKKFDHRGKNGRLHFLCLCDCGKERVVDYNRLQTGNTTSCGCRTESLGEEKVRIMLEELGIKFEQHYRGFTDMKDKGVLECDFWLPGFNRVIEYDGELHFETRERGWNTKQLLEGTQRRDQIKNQYCWDHNIDIIRIPYWDLDNFTMEDLVNKYSKYLVKEEKEIKNGTGI